jgi:hypothetical protein
VAVDELLKNVLSWWRNWGVTWGHIIIRWITNVRSPQKDRD